MKFLKISKTLLLGASLWLLAGNFTAQAHPFKTPSGEDPTFIHWAVLESAPGKMAEMGAMAAKDVAPTVAKESGTYALYGGIDKTNPNIMRLLEIYESEDAYNKHVSSPGFLRYKANRVPILKNLKFLDVTPIVLEQKASGEGHLVKMRLLEINKADIATASKLLKEEMTRAVKDENGVMGLFATAEKARPNMIHTFELFSDEETYNKYVASKEYKNYQNSLKKYVLSEHPIENVPTTVKLSTTGVKTEK